MTLDHNNEIIFLDAEGRPHCRDGAARVSTISDITVTSWYVHGVHQRQNNLPVEVEDCTRVDHGYMVTYYVNGHYALTRRVYTIEETLIPYNELSSRESRDGWDYQFANSDR